MFCQIPRNASTPSRQKQEGENIFRGVENIFRGVENISRGVETLKRRRLEDGESH